MTWRMISAADAPQTEDPRTRARRRIQQRKCLVCGARQLHNNNSAFFCSLHFGAWRWCCICETLRPAAEHGGKPNHCRACHAARVRQEYRANPDAARYAVALKRMATRQNTTEDLIFEHMRRRITLAAIVRATPGWTWAQRARAYSMSAWHMVANYNRQRRGDVRDLDWWRA
jgi:hypothetical protein